MAENASGWFFENDSFKVDIEEKKEDLGDKLENVSKKILKIGLIGYAALCVYAFGHAKGYRLGKSEGLALGVVQGCAETTDRILSVLGK